jgi:glycosyltransferase involved in cell wall biosynthesis
VAVSATHSTSESNGTLLNYMAMALPIVAYDGPVAREILGPAGVLVPLGDTAALAAACVRLLADPGERARRGQALRERVVREFDWASLGAALAEVYRDVQRDGGRRRGRRDRP